MQHFGIRRLRSFLFLGLGVLPLCSFAGPREASLEAQIQSLLEAQKTLLEAHRQSQAKIERLEGRLEELEGSQSPVLADPDPTPASEPKSAWERLMGGAEVEVEYEEESSGAPPSPASKSLIDWNLSFDRQGDGTPTFSNAKGLQMYGYLDTEYSNTSAKGAANEHGTFDLHRLYFGAYGKVHGNWYARAEMEWEHGFSSTSTGTTGKAEIDRAFLEHRGEHGTLAIGQVFSPFGFWSPVHQAIFQYTAISPLQFGNLFSETQNGITYYGRGEDFDFNLGLYNGSGAREGQADDNDNKAILVGFEKRNFLRGRIGFDFLTQRDGTNANQKEKMFVFSLDQDLGNHFNLWAEYFFENSDKVGGLGHNDSYYLDLRYDISDKLSTTLRYDTIQHDPGSVGFLKRDRKLLNFHYRISPVLRLKFDFYRDTFDDPTQQDATNFDIQLAAAFGLF